MVRHFKTDYFIYNKKISCDLLYVYKWLKLFVNLDKLKSKKFLYSIRDMFYLTELIILLIDYHHKILDSLKYKVLHKKK